MNVAGFIFLLSLHLGVFQIGYGRNASTRPAVVNIGAMFNFDSIIGRVAKIAIDEALKDVNSNSSILKGTKLSVTLQDTNCNGFLGMVEALRYMATDVVAIIGPQCSVVAPIISHVASELRFPLLSFAATDPTLSSLQFPFFVRTAQSDLYQMTAVADIIDHYGWKEVIAIFIDDDWGRNGVSALNDKLAERRCKISYKEFDAVVGDIAIVTNRTRIVDFTQPYVSSGLVIVARLEKERSGAWAFLQPFSRRMWIVTGSFFLIVGIVVWILEHRINDEFRGPPKQQVITILWFSFSTMFFAHRENTMSTLGRLVLLVWLFVVLIINSSYTASLTSILTVEHLSSSIKGIQSLAATNEPIGYQEGSFAERYLSEELNISRSRLVSLGSPEAYALALKRGPGNGGVAAVVDERPYVELFLSSQCSFKIVGQEFTKSGWGFAFPRDSPLAIDMSTAILALAENGDLQRIHDKWLMQSTCSLESTEIETNQLNLSSFWGLFLICGVACIIALFIYFLQILQQLPPAPESASITGQDSSHSRRLRRFLSLMDEKEEQSRSGQKRRKVDNERDDEFGS